MLNLSPRTISYSCRQLLQRANGSVKRIYAPPIVQSQNICRIPSLRTLVPSYPRTPLVLPPPSPRTVVLSYSRTLSEACVRPYPRTVVVHRHAPPRLCQTENPKLLAGLCGRA
jgi:hypothetical protein